MAWKLPGSIPRLNLRLKTHSQCHRAYAHHHLRNGPDALSIMEIER
jgi:hypothetical protein